MREREKKEREEIREEEERQRARQRARERESAREQKGTVPCDCVLAEERRRRLYCAGPIPPPPPPTYSGVRVLENYYLNKYIHGGKFENSFLKIFFPEFLKKTVIQFAKARDH